MISQSLPSNDFDEDDFHHEMIYEEEEEDEDHDFEEGEEVFYPYLQEASEEPSIVSQYILDFKSNLTIVCFSFCLICLENNDLSHY